VAAYSGDEYTNGSTSKAFTLVVKSTSTTKLRSTAWILMFTAQRRAADDEHGAIGLR
jgi:hypothetical protein